VYRAFGAAMEEVERSGSLPPPLVILNAPTGLMKELGYGAGYQYAHDLEGGIADQQHMPDELVGRRFYEPTDSGYEAEVAKRMKAWEALLGKGRGRTSRG
jgi:putative ATPase